MVDVNLKTLSTSLLSVKSDKYLLINDRKLLEEKSRILIIDMFEQDRTPVIYPLNQSTIAVINPEYSVIALKGKSSDNETIPRFYPIYLTIWHGLGWDH